MAAPTRGRTRRFTSALATLALIGGMGVVGATEAGAEEAAFPTTATVTAASAADGLTVQVNGEGYTDLPVASTGQPAAGVYAAIRDVTTSNDDITADNALALGQDYVTPARITDGSWQATLSAQTADLEKDASYEVMVWIAHGNPTADTVLATVPLTLTAEQTAALWPAAEEAPSPFPDVAKTNLHYDNIVWLAENNITMPVDGLYHPKNPVSRASMTMFLYRLVNPNKQAPVCTEKPFSDVEVDDLFCGSIMWAKDNGVTFGLSNGTFNPKGTVNRGSMSAFLKRIVDPGATVECTEKPFTDVNVDDLFCTTIAWAKDAEVTFGIGDGTQYGPDLNVNRQSMASFLHRAYDLRQ